MKLVNSFLVTIFFITKPIDNISLFSNKEIDNNIFGVKSQSSHRFHQPLLRKINNNNADNFKLSSNNNFKGSNDERFSIISYKRKINEDGSYKFAYKTENRINHHEEALIINRAANLARIIHGEYSYASPEGQIIKVNYEADKNGFHATGDHLPTPPSIPDAYLYAIRLHELASGRGIEKPPKPVVFISS